MASYRTWLLACATAGAGSIACLSIAAAQDPTPLVTQSTSPAVTAPEAEAAPDAKQEPDQALEHLDVLIEAGQYPEAIEEARRSLATLEAAGQEESIATALTLDRLVEALQRHGEGVGDEAFEVAQRALGLKRSLLGDHDPETAQSLLNLGNIQLARMDVGSLDSYRQALAMFEATLGPDSPEAADAKYGMARSIFFDQGDFETARKLLEEVLALRERIFGPEDLAVGSTLYMLGGGVYSALGKCAEAKAATARAVTIYRKALGNQHPSLVPVLRAFGFSASLCNDLAEARAAYEEAVAIAEDTSGPESADAGVALYGLSGVLEEQGDYPAALDAAERGYQIVLKIFGPNHDQSLEALGHIAVLYDDLGESNRGAELEREIVRRTELVYGTDHPNVARALHNLGGTLAFDLGRPEDAKPLLERALHIREQAFGPSNEWVASTLVNLSGGVYQPLEEFELARDYATRALTIRETLESPPLSIASASYHVAEALRALGDTQGALKYARRVLQIRRETLGEAHPDVAEAQFSLARALVADDQFEAGLAAVLEGERIARDHQILLARGLSERQALAYQARRESGLGLMMTLAVQPGVLSGQNLETIWDSVARSRGLIFDQMARRRRATARSEEPEIRQLSEEVSEASRRLAELVVRGPGGSDSEEFARDIETARQDRQTAERALAARSSDFRAELAEGEARLAEMLERLPGRAALVSFVRFQRFDAGPQPAAGGKAEYLAFATLRDGGTPAAIRLGDADRIDALAGDLRVILAQEMLAAGRTSPVGETAYRMSAQALRRAVWDPVRSHVAGAERVFIVPDGALYLIDFAALPDDDGRYLVETLPPLHYLSTERDLLMDAPAMPGGPMLALGAPDFEGAELFAALQSEPAPRATTGTNSIDIAYRGPRSACGSFQTMSFEPLPGSYEEVSEVLDLWRQGSGNQADTTLLTGAAASETAFKQLAAGKRVLHLATHGFFLGGDCGSTLNPLAGDNVTNENPLLLSGLVLAGANHRAAAGPDEDDGILTAEEIATLDLRDTEWAVLSACDTGRGEIRAGEGVFGLQRAFRVAGARTTIMSLWPVEDEVTRRWMTALYRHHFAEGLSTMESVHAASLELLQQRRAQGLSTHPFYWVGFIASGDWR